MGILNSFSIETAENDRVDITAMDSDTYLLVVGQNDADDERSAQFTKEEIEIFAKKILPTLEENK